MPPPDPRVLALVLLHRLLQGAPESTSALDGPRVTRREMIVKVCCIVISPTIFLHGVDAQSAPSPLAPDASSPTAAIEALASAAPDDVRPCAGSYEQTPVDAFVMQAGIPCTSSARPLSTAKSPTSHRTN